MKHVHKRFTTDQVKLLVSAYLKRRMTREEVEKELGIGKTRFFALLKKYKNDPDRFSLSYHRNTPKKLSTSVELAIIEGLHFDKQLIADPNVPITTYNYSALRDRLQEKNITVSVNTIIARAKTLDCYTQLTQVCNFQIGTS